MTEQTISRWIVRIVCVALGAVLTTIAIHVWRHRNDPSLTARTTRTAPARARHRDASATFIRSGRERLPSPPQARRLVHDLRRTTSEGPRRVSTLRGQAVDVGPGSLPPTYPASTRSGRRRRYGDQYTMKPKKPAREGMALKGRTMTCEEVARCLGLTRVRVALIEREAIRKLRERAKELGLQLEDCIDVSRPERP